MGSNLGSPLGSLLDSDTWPPVDIQMMVDIPPGAKVRHPELVVSTSQATLAVSPSGSCPNFLAPSSGMCPTSP